MDLMLLSLRPILRTTSSQPQAVGPRSLLLPIAPHTAIYNAYS